MIVQSCNEPIIIKCNDNMEGRVLRVTIWQVEGLEENKLIKSWTENDVEIENNIIKCPLSQEETKTFPKTEAIFEMKWLDEDGIVRVSKKIPILIADRNDLEPLEGGI